MNNMTPDEMAEQMKGREKQRITSINIEIVGPGGKVLFSSRCNAGFTSLSIALRNFKRNVKQLAETEPEKFKNIIIQ